MSSYTRKLIESAVVWPRNGTTRNGAPQVAAPQEIACRWLGSESLSRRLAGVSAAGSGMVLVDRALAVGSLIFQGQVTEAVGSFGPVFEVAKTSKVVTKRYSAHFVELGALTSTPVVAVNGDYIISTLSLKWAIRVPYTGVSQEISETIADGDVVQISSRTASGTVLADLWNIASDFDVAAESTLDLTGAGFVVGDVLTIINFGQT